VKQVRDRISVKKCAAGDADPTQRRPSHSRNSQARTTSHRAIRRAIVLESMVDIDSARGCKACSRDRSPRSRCRNLDTEPATYRGDGRLVGPGPIGNRLCNVRSVSYHVAQCSADGVNGSVASSDGGLLS